MCFIELGILGPRNMYEETVQVIFEGHSFWATVTVILQPSTKDAPAAKSPLTIHGTSADEFQPVLIEHPAYNRAAAFLRRGPRSHRGHPL